MNLRFLGPCLWFLISGTLVAADAQPPFPENPVMGEVQDIPGKTVMAAFTVAVKLVAPQLHLQDRVILRKLPLPSYPEEMFNIGVYGKCDILFDLAADGSVTNVRVGTSVNPEFGAVAVEAVKQWKFEPLKQSKREELSPVQVTATFIFSKYY